MMNWISLIFLLILVGFVIWLMIDTAIYIVKKIKAKKNHDQLNNDDVDNAK